MTATKTFVSMTALVDSITSTYATKAGEIAIQFGGSSRGVYVNLDPAAAHTLIDQINAALRELAAKEVDQ